MNILNDIKPLSFFKQKTSEVIKHIKSTKKPTFITINGNVEVVVQDAESYQAMMDYINNINDSKKITKALNEIENGEGKPLEDSFKAIEKKYKLNS